MCWPKKKQQWRKKAEGEKLIHGKKRWKEVVKERRIYPSAERERWTDRQNVMAIVGSAASKPIRIRNQLVEGWPTWPDLPPIDDRANNLRPFSRMELICQTICCWWVPASELCVCGSAPYRQYFGLYSFSKFFGCAELPPSCFQYLLREMFLAQNLFF